jgi:hypothetical protein
MYSFRFNDADGILEVRASGMWNATTVESYRRDLGIEAAAARRRAGKLKLLFNAVGYAVQPQIVAQSAQQIDRVVLPGDRVAVVIETSLLKLQARRVFAGWDRIELFVAEDAARSWLLSGDAAAASHASEPARATAG